MPKVIMLLNYRSGLQQKHVFSYTHILVLLTRLILLPVTNIYWMFSEHLIYTVFQYSQKPCKVDTNIILILQMKKTENWDTEKISNLLSHTANEW